MLPTIDIKEICEGYMVDWQYFHFEKTLKIIKKSQLPKTCKI